MRRCFSNSPRRLLIRNERNAQTSPLESHLSSATARHRQEKEQNIKKARGLTELESEKTISRRTLKVGGVLKERKPLSLKLGLSELAEESSSTPNLEIVGGRIKRPKQKVAASVLNSGGSIAATMSATFKHRQLRNKTLEGNPLDYKHKVVVKNPSSLSIPIGNCHLEQEQSIEEAQPELNLKENKSGKESENATSGSMVNFAGIFATGGAAGIYYFDLIPTF